MKPMKRSRAGLTRSAAALGLMLAAVAAAAPACAEDAAGKASANDPSKAQAGTPTPQASTEQKDESAGTAKAANPCAVSKKKKKSPCAVGG